MVERFYRGEPPREVTVREGAEKWPLDPRLHLRERSAAIFAWGPEEYNGGPAHQPAVALLADALQDDARASALHRDFCTRVVAVLPARWTMTVRTPPRGQVMLKR